MSGAATQLPFNDSFGGNIVDVIGQHVVPLASRAAIIDSRRTIDYRDLHGLILRSASHLATFGVTNGQRVGLMLQDHADHLVMIFACTALGAVSVSLNWRGKIDEKQRFAEAFGLELIVGDPGVRAPARARTILLDEAWHAAVAATPPTVAMAAGPNTAFRILLTSGTTGKPKGVELTHAGGIAWAQSVNLALGLSGAHHHLSTLPLAFTGSLVFNLSLLLLGHTVELLPPLFTPQELIAKINAGGITGCVVVPTSLRRLLALAPDTGPLFPALRYLVSAGAPLTPDERRAARQKLTLGFYDNYGASGAGPITFLAPDDIEARPDSVGRAAPLRQIEIVDDAGQAVPVGAIGRLRCKGVGVASRFCNDPADSATELFEGGWYYPGELARIDGDGFVHIVGRTSDLIIRGGHNIYPSEVEQVLLGCSGVVEAAVVGRHNPEYGEDVLAFVRVIDGVSKQELFEACRRALTAHKVPVEIHFAADFPRNDAGKVLRAELLRSVDTN